MKRLKIRKMLSLVAISLLWAGVGHSSPALADTDTFKDDVAAIKAAAAVDPEKTRAFLPPAGEFLEGDRWDVALNPIGKRNMEVSWEIKDKQWQLVDLAKDFINLSKDIKPNIRSFKDIHLNPFKYPSEPFDGLYVASPDGLLHGYANGKWTDYPIPTVIVTPAGERVTISERVTSQDAQIFTERIAIERHGLAHDARVAQEQSLATKVATQAVASPTPVAPQAPISPTPVAPVSTQTPASGWTGLIVLIGLFVLGWIAAIIYWVRFKRAEREASERVARGEPAGWL